MTLPLTPRARLRLTCLMVDGGGWSPAQPSATTCPGPRPRGGSTVTPPRTRPFRRHAPHRRREARCLRRQRPALRRATVRGKGADLGTARTWCWQYRTRRHPRSPRHPRMRRHLPVCRPAATADRQTADGSFIACPVSHTEAGQCTRSPHSAGNRTAPGGSSSGRRPLSRRHASREPSTGGYSRATSSRTAISPQWCSSTACTPPGKQPTRTPKAAVSSPSATHSQISKRQCSAASASNDLPRLPSPARRAVRSRNWWAIAQQIGTAVPWDVVTRVYSAWG